MLFYRSKCLSLEIVGLFLTMDSRSHVKRLNLLWVFFGRCHFLPQGAGLQRDFFLCLGFPGDNLVLDLMAYYRCFWKGQFKLIFRLVYIFCLHYEWLHCLMSAEQVMTSDIPLYLQLENRIGFFKHLFYSEINNLNFTIIYFLFGSGSVKAKVRRNWNRYIVITYILLLTFVMKPKSYLLFVIS
jgi:hypothetical protein